MNFLHTLKRIFSDKGLLLTLGFSLAVLLVFYGKLLVHPCHTYLGQDGDGMQIYYETLYHIKFDPEFWRQHSINYPYGESIFFTGTMPLLANLVKIFGSSAAPLGIGAINLMVLFSPVIGALFIYAIFRHLRVAWHYGAVCATAIAFLSPQMSRFTAHYSLAWVFMIPAMLYMLLRFYDFPSVKKSFLIALIVFIGEFTHLYYLAFFLAIGGIYWATLFFTNDRGFRRIGFVLKHSVIQFLLPILIFEILAHYSDTVTDRTAQPWGYLVYHSNFSGIFFPFDRPYTNLFLKFWNPSFVEFEGKAYVGLAAIAGLIAIAGIQIYRMARLKFRLIFSITDHKVLNIFFWTSVFLLFISFAKPFLNGHEEWLLHMGPLQQFRAIGRLAWVFFYVINIIVVYRLFKVSQRNRYVLAATLFFVPALLLFDTYYTIKGKQEALINHIAELDDENNLLPQDKWLKGFNSSAYQAILPLPYFHIGSENICRIPDDPEIIEQSYFVSLKTGLPLLGVASARVSLSQSAKLISLVLNPVAPAGVLKDIKDQRPFLVFVLDGTLDENEQRLVALSKPIGRSLNYKLYSLSPAVIATIPERNYEAVRTQIDTLKKFSAGSFTSSDSGATVIYNSYDNLSGKPYLGSGSFLWKSSDDNEIFNSVINVAGNYTCSFWMNHIHEDVYTRLTIEISADDETGKVKTYYAMTDALRQVKAIDGNWGLIEFPMVVPAAGMRARIRIHNSDVPKGTAFEFDELLFKPEHAIIYRTFGDTIQLNNCLYHPWK